MWDVKRSSPTHRPLRPVTAPRHPPARRRRNGGEPQASPAPTPRAADPQRRAATTAGQPKTWEDPQSAALRVALLQQHDTRRPARPPPTATMMPSPPHGPYGSLVVGRRRDHLHDLGAGLVGQVAADLLGRRDVAEDVARSGRRTASGCPARASGCAASWPRPSRTARSASCRARRRSPRAARPDRRGAPGGRRASPGRGRTSRSWWRGRRRRPAPVATAILLNRKVPRCGTAASEVRIMPVLYSFDDHQHPEDDHRQLAEDHPGEADEGRVEGELVLAARIVELVLDSAQIEHAQRRR